MKSESHIPRVPELNLENLNSPAKYAGFTVGKV
jgi:hypothetical protein